MTDIVERMRKQCTCEQCAWEVEEVLKEAADEIERLREALERLAELDGFVCGRPMLGQTVINYTQFVARAALGEKE